MKVLNVLEEKIKSLVTLIKGRKTESETLQADKEKLKTENDGLKTENAKFAEDNAQLTAQLRSIEGSMLKETDQVKELKQERSATKAVVDDLIKSIDALVEHENQQ